jgi:PAS domain S-box-containing protein
MDNPIPLRILVIEDDVDTCDNLRDILELDDHRVSIAHSARAALQNAELAQANVILLDWKLPDATALEVLPQLSAAAPDADVIIVTGHGEFNHAVSALRQGAADYLLKPINPQALRSSLQRLAHRRWLAQAKLRSEAMFRNLVEAAPCLIVILRRDLSIAYFSPFAETLTGYPAQEVLNKSFVETFLPEEDDALVAEVVETVFSQQASSGHQTIIRGADGARRWMIWNAKLLDDVDGAPGILAVGQDVTEYRRANEKAVQAERLAAIGEAMTGLAHESRNALQRSQAFLELLEVEVAGRPEALKLVARIQEAQNHLHQLYEEVRQYAAPIRLDAAAYAPEELLQETWAYLEVSRRDRVARLILENVATCCEVHVDRFLIGQVFRNILENSLAACPDPVEIRFTCQPFRDDAGDWVRLALRDNGPGLSAEQREHIFDPFYTTKTRGTGLGMTLCKRIVEAHGGSISIGAGPGTEIVILLPAEPPRTSFAPARGVPRRA